MRMVALVVLLVAATPGLAGSDFHKNTDDRALFYIRVCPGSPGENDAVRTILKQRREALISGKYEPDDLNDFDWRYVYTDESNYQRGEYDRVSEVLTNPVDSTALSTSPPAPERYCGPKPGEFVELNKDGTVAAAFGGERVVYEDAGSVGTGISGGAYSADGQADFSVIFNDNDDESFVTVVRNGADSTYARCP